MYGFFTVFSQSEIVAPRHHRDDEVQHSGFEMWSPDQIQCVASCFLQNDIVSLRMKHHCVGSVV